MNRVVLLNVLECLFCISLELVRESFSKSGIYNLSLRDCCYRSIIVILAKII